ncbi:MAG: hypothetical protein V4699_00195 [Patescibacteria group bacterium]
MKSRTPKFNALLDKILDNAVPSVVSCKECGEQFEIFIEDINMYKLLRVPVQKICPNCRQQRRLSFTNYSHIFRTPCKAPGHHENVISIMPPEMPWIGYDFDYYNSDAWNPQDYEPDLEEGNFFDYYFDLLSKIPQPLVRRGVGSTNSDYSFYGKNMKNCYYVFSSHESENVMYSTSIFQSKDVIDSYYVRSIEMCHNNVLTIKCYKCTNIYFSNDCVQSDFLYDCRNCINCFGCVNLRNKSNCFFNVQLSKSEYEQKRKEIDLGKRSNFEKYNNKFWELVKASPISANRIRQSNNAVGNDIDNCKNAYFVSQAEESENVRYGQMFIGIKDSMDFGFCGTSEKLYEIVNVGAQSSNVKFGYASKYCIDCEYIFSCHNCTNCFGCVGLKNVSYAIFNKVYEPEEYFRIVDDLKVRLLNEGNYGEYFPYKFSNFAYNTSMAQILYPLTKEQIMAKGAYWQDEIKVVTGSLETVKSENLPDDIDDLSDDIFGKAILSASSENPFRFVPTEIEFYKRYRISLPTMTPLERNLERYERMGNFRIFQDNCFSCGQTIWSGYQTKDGFKPYCEKCYQQEVY